MAENEVVTDTRVSMVSQMGKAEDWWAIWLAAFFFIVVTVFTFIWKPPVEELPKYRAIMDQEMEQAGFRTMAYTEAEKKLKSIRARNHGLTKTLRSITDRPKGWSTNPIRSFYMSESAAAEKRAAAADRFERAKENLAEVKTKAEAAENAARQAQFKDPQLNEQARSALAEWREASAAHSKAKAAANTKPYNLIPSLIVLGIVMMLFFAIGGKFIGFNLREYFIGFPVIYLLSIVSYMLGNQATFKALGISYVLFAIFLGLIIANITGVTKSIRTAGQTEFFIKTGLVLLGARILFGQIAMIGIPGLFVTWVVTPIVLLVTYWFGQNIIKVPSKELNITVSADMCVSGVSAAIATASACRAKREELTLAIGMSMIFVAIMIFALPAIANMVGMHPVLAGAWLGGTVDNTGSVVAAGELIGYEAMVVAATIKMIQNIMIGVIAFGVAAYWALKIEPERERKPGESPVKLSFSGAMYEIWYRFPKFILGFIGASIVFSIMQAAVSMDWGNAMVSEGVLSLANRYRGWFFGLAFVSIGLSINFQELKEPLRGGKPVILYVFGQTFNLILTFLMAWLMFMVIFRDITEKLMLGV
ncbi:MAG: putative sulfate exporter family transporter [Desulfobacterales bacterium]|nr:putative sulfate exporter family transporter [Desulfobacterales bacterium]